jgi:hypothetical protein
VKVPIGGLVDPNAERVDRVAIIQGVRVGGTALPVLTKKTAPVVETGAEKEQSNNLTIRS